MKMDILRVGALNPPEKGKSPWARDILNAAISRKLKPLMVPSHEIQTFTVPLPPGTAKELRALADELSLSLAEVSAGLIAATTTAETVSTSKTSVSNPKTAMPGEELVRDTLLPLMRASAKGAAAGKIVFAEAATGTGKGQMIAVLAADAAERGDTVVIAAPLAVTWQLLDDLEKIPAANTAGVSLALGRPNFISPSRTLQWAKENKNPELVAWLEAGGLPLSEHASKASAFISRPLRWLLEDALSLAEDLPITSVMLDNEEDEDCQAERVYQSLRENHGNAAITICSHYYLAAHVRQVRLRGLTGKDELTALGSDLFGEPKTLKTLLPIVIDTVLVDEAHLLEQAFAAIYSQALFVKPLQREVERQIMKGRAPLMAALDNLEDCIRRLVKHNDSNQASRQLSDYEGLEAALQGSLNALADLNLKGVSKATKYILHAASRALVDALSGHSMIRLELSPVRHYPQLVVGRSNLDRALESMWDNVAGAVLVSATLYQDESSANLSRWKLAVPKAHTLYLEPVHPAWTREPVTLHKLRAETRPDDSELWADQAAACIQSITDKAEGGTLVLCTSHTNAEQLALRLPSLGDRLVMQSRTMGAASCATQYRELYRQGKRPVWIGVGSSWTGINLSDTAVPAHEDFMLTDLVITRLPAGLNRTLTHERRHALAGFMLVAQETSWHFRQGLGRLIRREGVLRRNLWVLDSRVDSTDKAHAWITPCRKILNRYRSAD